ncbi:MAG: DUF4097 domain-containing protein [Clostridiales bacterium]|jgi:DUF4097 and DUF4098 domain-containing protein YvlB|nr:DUF4097 domain-containing protein [Clostridiales bacterium]
MASEKLRILKLLEEGKITADEAARLLDAADPSSSSTSYRAASSPSSGASPSSASARASSSSTYSSSSSSSSSYNSNDSRRRASSSSAGASSGASGGLDDFTSELGRKFEAFARDLEPKLHRFSETVAEKTSDLADKISRSLDEPRRTTSSYAYSSTSSASTSSASSSSSYPGTTEKRFELGVGSGYNEVNISGLNGDVLLKGYNGDKITARIFVKPKRPNAPLELMKLGNKYFLNYDEDDFEKVCVDAYIPERLFSVANIGTINGVLDLSSLETETISLSNANGPTKLKGLTSGFLKADCSNGRLTLSAISAKNAQIENFNGIIDALDLDCANLKLVSVTGGITVNISSFTRFNEYMWDVETSNGKMTLNLPSMPDLGYHIKAQTTLGNIKIGLSNLNYITNASTHAEARSYNYSSCRRTAKFALQTSNGPLQIS